MPLAAAVISATLSFVSHRFLPFVQFSRAASAMIVDRLGLAGADGQAGGATVFPRAEALLDASRRPDQRFQIHPFVGHRRGGLFLAMREIEFLNSVGGVAEAVTDHDVLMEVLVAMAHAADIQRDLRLQCRPARP